MLCDGDSARAPWPASPTPPTVVTLTPARRAVAGVAARTAGLTALVLTLLAGCAGASAADGAGASALTSPVVSPLAGTAPASPVPASPEAVASPAPEGASGISAVAAPQTSEPLRLTICLDDEPEALLPYLDESDAARAVRAALALDGVQAVGYACRSQLVVRMPSLEDGSAVLKPIRVHTGDVVLDAAGEVVRLAPGVRVRPAGCRNPACATTYTGREIEMDQMLVSFELRDDLVWPDGTPVVAEDSVFSYALARNPAMPDGRTIEERTASYVATGERTVVWTGLPGYLPQDYATAFWTPLPAAWADVRLVDLLQRDEAIRELPGPGPYTTASWVPGVALRLVRNPAYVGPQPAFDVLIFRFPGASGTVEGPCDVVLDDAAAPDATLHPWVQPEPTWEHLVFNVTGPLGDVRVRQAVAACIDRAAVNALGTGGRGTLMDSYAPPDHPLAVLEPGLGVVYDPVAGANLLTEAGWVDADGDGIHSDGVREAVAPAGDDPGAAQGAGSAAEAAPTIVPGTPLILRYVTTDSEAREGVVDEIARQLGACGIALDVATYAPWELYAQSASGILAAGAFDVAQIATVAGVHPACEAYASWGVPGDDNGWAGPNIGRFSDAEFDSACAVASTALPGEESYVLAHQAAQRSFAATLPALPLYRRASGLAVRPDLLGLTPDPLAPATWNLVAWTLGE